MRSRTRLRTRFSRTFEAGQKRNCPTFASSVVNEGANKKSILSFDPVESKVEIEELGGSMGLKHPWKYHRPGNEDQDQTKLA
jgi:hypothetical protein